jgi:hypothetical protein
MFLLDPSDLGIPVEGSSLTYANLEQRNTRRMQVALMPWIRRIESALSPLVAGGVYRFDVDSRLRGNTRESYETLKVAIDAGFMTEDEVREILGLEPMGSDVMPPEELARVIQMIYLGVGVVVSVDEAREILNRAGADLAPGFEQTIVFGQQADEGDGEERMRQRFVDLLEQVRRDPVIVNHHTHVDSPDITVEPTPVTVENRMDAPTVNVDVPEQRMEAPVVQVTVDPPPVNITNEVNVEPTPVTIENEVTVEGREAGTTSHRVFRDRNGNITGIESTESD